MSRKTTRVQLELPEKAMELLQSLQERTESVSYAQVVRNALKLYGAILDRQDKGQELILRSADGTETTLELIV
jgi:ABC-type Fe3+-hydroxamate transport system substrate-binding protein